VFLCITPNAAVDRTLIVPGFKDRGVFRTGNKVIAAGGKGLNVARAIKLLGGEVLCAGFLGGHSGRLIEEMALAEGLPGVWTQIAGESRTCVIIADPERGETAVVNEEGPEVTAADWERLQSDILRAATNIEIICFSGSLPPGSPLESYTTVLRALQQTGKQLWVDTSGQSLRAALDVPGISIKVNDHEIAAILDQPIDDIHSAAHAAQQVRMCAKQHVVLTLGSKGAVMTTESGQWHAQPPHLEIVSTVGSGDCFLAGLVTALSRTSPQEALKHGVAAGSANALSAGGGTFSIADFHRILERTTLIPIR
jgi:1-phosphofructokinase family hexose kinase